jgi:hypothetical protein
MFEFLCVLKLLVVCVCLCVCVSVCVCVCVCLFTCKRAPVRACVVGGEYARARSIHAALARGKHATCRSVAQVMQRREILAVMTELLGGTLRYS